MNQIHNIPLSASTPIASHNRSLLQPILYSRHHSLSRYTSLNSNCTLSNRNSLFDNTLFNRNSLFNNTLLNRNSLFHSLFLPTIALLVIITITLLPQHHNTMILLPLHYPFHSLRHFFVNYLLSSDNLPLGVI